MVLCGPCSNPACPDRTNSSGQWQLIPSEFCDENDFTYGTDTVCKKADCKRWCGISPAEKTKPGRKAATRSDEPVLEPGFSTGASVRAGCPPIIDNIEEIWACR